MEVYKHTWKDKKTGRVVVAEGRTALNLDEAIEQFYEEDSSSWQYDHTIVLNLEKRTFSWLDIEEEIAQRELAAMSDSELSWHKGVQHGFNHAKEGAYG